MRRAVVDAIKEGVKEKEQNATLKSVSADLTQLQHFERLHWLEPI